jgi:hypothetical protein
VCEGGRGESGGAVAGPHGQPGAEVLDVAAADVGDEPDVGRLLGQERGEGPQRLVGVADAAGAQDHGQPLQVPPHRCDDVRDSRAVMFPVGEPLSAGHDRFPSTTEFVGSLADNSLPGSICASMASAARRYCEASQSSARCN